MPLTWYVFVATQGAPTNPTSSPTTTAPVAAPVAEEDATAPTTQAPTAAPTVKTTNDYVDDPQRISASGTTKGSIHASVVVVLACWGLSAMSESIDYW